MFHRKIAKFSPCGELFVCVNDAGILTIWETATNNVKQEFDVKSHLNTSCSSLIWGSFKVTSNEDDSGDVQFLIIGSKDGDIYLYNYSTGKIYKHFSSGHDSDVNDLSLYPESNHLYSCSNDKTLIAWDTNSGKLYKKWTVCDEEIYSVCVVDCNNLLIGSTSIIWWSIKEESILKKFNQQTTPITILSTVNSLDVSSSVYFLSVTASDSKISAWSLNENCNGAVASFVLKSEPQNIDASKNFSKDNPLILTATTEEGTLVLFEHVLNGKTQNLTPQMTLQVMSKPTYKESPSTFIPIISSKILDCAESCLIAYGDEDGPIFESVNIFDCPKTLVLARDRQVNSKVYDPFVSKIKLCKKSKEHSQTNGETSSDLSFNSPKRRKVVENNIEATSTLKNSSTSLNTLCLNNRIPNSSPTVKKRQKNSKKVQEQQESESETEYVLPTDPSEILSTLLRGIEEKNISIVNSVLHCNDSEIIKATVRNLPLQSLNLVLIEFYRRLKLEDQRYNSSLSRWVKEVLSYHLPYLISCNDLQDILNEIKELIEKKRVSQTLLKMNMLRGLLRVQIKNISSEDSDIEELVTS